PTRGNDSDSDVIVRSVGSWNDSVVGRVVAGALWLIVTHCQSVRSDVVRYGFDACSKQVGLPENGSRGVKPSRRWNSSDVPRNDPVVAPASRQACALPSEKLPPPLAGSSSLNTMLVSAISSGIALVL